LQVQQATEDCDADIWYLFILKQNKTAHIKNWWIQYK